MLPFLLLLVAAQVPPVPGETTLVSFCKNGSASACEALRQVNPQKAAELAREAAKAALRLEALKIAAEEAGEEEASDASDADAGASDEPPNCRGQDHHVISRPIAKKLEEHETLRGLYQPRDHRFVAKAKDKESHCGYQKWHREVDEEVSEWLEIRKKATAEQFEKFLRELYNRKDMRERFPDGFGPAT